MRTKEMEITRTRKDRQGILERLGRDGGGENEDLTTLIDLVIILGESMDLSMILGKIIEGESIDPCDQLTGDRGTGFPRYGRSTKNSQSVITERKTAGIREWPGDWPVQWPCCIPSNSRA